MLKKIKLNNQKQIKILISEKKHGSMRLDNNPQNKLNRIKFLEKNSISIEKLISAKLKNSNKCALIKNHQKKIIENTDALITDKPNLYLSITTADCIPVFFYSPQCVAIAHAGWRGITENIIPNTLKAFSEFELKKNLKIIMGPGIGSCHFKIQKDVLKKFKHYPKALHLKKQKIFVDLKKIIKQQLFKTGIPQKNIHNLDECTYCNSQKFFSARRERLKTNKVMLSIIAIEHQK
ncbi:MAG: peptidoglycan editing factor PgeF [Candidatus Moranbacteria bacterium]|nr:peptidoglycan editing factor PgeF [Candidatus Moranbacteria bacterium]